MLYSSDGEVKRFNTIVLEKGSLLEAFTVHAVAVLWS